ncbi:hypothetical protein H6F67_03380 [Microcoleus sp. FACHB-1515]|uniref:hypothetical protein n=1 Tax=Cyanophyceae TaxID=3028117 RepID=UPI001684A1C4|nr:hypothetical protein [Microcoleus sp. FACHB-1515]MBD2088892.1 hypothetical protein [Microcoleus sp. FACHB-1515]
MLTAKSLSTNATPYTTAAIERFAYVDERSDEFLKLFPHRGSYLWAEHPAADEKPQWQTENRHLLSDRLINQGSFLYGVRFGAATSYLMLDVDRTSRYHPDRDPYAIGRIVEALEPLGFYAHVAISSSYSGGLHLYFPFSRPVPSWAIARAATLLLENRGFKISLGNLEVFPNPKAYSMEPTLYSGHRLPLQAGSYILNADYQPIYGGRDRFVQLWRQAEQFNDIKHGTIEQIIKQHDRRGSRRIRGSAQKFLSDLNAEIELGWTDHGQTNRLLGRIATRLYVFGHVLFGGDPLTGDALASGIAETAAILPGFDEFCGHQRDMVDLCRNWARSVIRRYYPYGSKQKLQPDDEGMASHTPSWNDQQANDARERIRLAVNALAANDELPDGLTERRNAIAKASGTSVKTCYKNRDLWAKKSLKPAPSQEDHPVVPKVDDPRSLKPAPSKEDHPVVHNKLSPLSADAPPVQSAVEIPATAVGGCGGQEDAPNRRDVLLDLLKQIRARQAAKRHQRDNSPPPDENYFRQLNQRCEHSRAITGLDAHYCPDCRISIDYGTAGYERILQRSIERHRFRPSRSSPVNVKT